MPDRIVPGSPKPLTNADLLSALPAPLAIAEGRVFTVPSNIQMPFKFPIQVDGVLRVDGVLYEVADPQETFESVANNLRSYPSSIAYSGGLPSVISYTTPSGTITKTLTYSSGKVTSIVLAGATPDGIELTKTLSYTGDNLTGVAYS